jgi:ComEC/Rec2-related protein
MKRPLLPVALVYVIGLLLADVAQPGLPFLFALGFALLLPALVWAEGRALLLWPLLVVIGWVNLVSRTAVVSPNDLRRIVGNDPAVVTVRGALMETPELRIREQEDQVLSRTLARIRVSAMARRDAWQPAHGIVMVSTRGELPEEFFDGREVEISGVLAPPQRPVAPGLFDYREYLARQGIHYQLRADSARDWRIVDGAERGPPFADRFLVWAKRALARGLPEEDEPLRLMWAMTLGWKTALTGEVNEPFMRSGTMHIFAISGLHIALIAGILVRVLRVLRVPRDWCGVVVIPLIWFYTGATGWQSSAIRSTVMMTIIIGGWSLRRPGDLLNSLAAAAFLILLWDPRQLFQASFQLSFFVVLSIALFMPPLERLRDRLLAGDSFLAPEVMTKWQRIRQAALRAATAGLVTSLAAWLGSLPLSAHYFHLFSPVTLLANLIIVPMSGAALMCGLGSLLCGDWLPWAAELFNHCAWFWMLCMMKISRWAAELPGAWCHVKSPAAFTFVIYYGSLIGTMSGWLWKREQRGRTLAALVLVTAFYGRQFFETRKNLELTILPLHGGQAEYLDAPGRTGDWLIDCGNTNEVGFILEPFLRARGVNRVPRLILTHGDLRHVGGLETLEETFRVDEVFAGVLRFRSPAYRRLFEKLNGNPGRLRALQRGEQSGPWQVLHPDATDRFQQADDGALALRGDFNGTRVLLLSDLGRAGQEKLMERTADLRADVVVSGLPTQTEPLCDSLLDAAQPRLVIVADSELPATERAGDMLKERLASRRVPVLYTSETGALTIFLRPDGCEIRPVNGRRLFLRAGQ